MNLSQKLGKKGESVAVRYLKKLGYKMVERNYRSKAGEIDIIAREKKTLVFVEVKTRSNDRFGYPEAAVTPKKRAHLLDAAQAFMQTLPDTEYDWRIDVIAIRKQGSSKLAEIVHFENAVP